MRCSGSYRLMRKTFSTTTYTPLFFGEENGRFISEREPFGGNSEMTNTKRSSDTTTRRRKWAQEQTAGKVLIMNDDLHCTMLSFVPERINWRLWSNCRPIDRPSRITILCCLSVFVHLLGRKYCTRSRTSFLVIVNFSVNLNVSAIIQTYATRKESSS